MDTHDIMDKSESPDCPSIHFNTFKQPLNNGRPTTSTLYNRQFSRSQLYASNTQRPRFSGHSLTFLIARLRIPRLLEAPDLRTPHYNGQNVGSQWCLL